jgi:hypothetical protein
MSSNGNDVIAGTFHLPFFIEVKKVGRSKLLDIHQTGMILFILEHIKGIVRFSVKRETGSSIDFKSNSV